MSDIENIEEQLPTDKDLLDFPTKISTTRTKKRKRKRTKGPAKK